MSAVARAAGGAAASAAGSAGPSAAGAVRAAADSGPTARNLLDTGATRATTTRVQVLGNDGAPMGTRTTVEVTGKPRDWGTIGSGVKSASTGIALIAATGVGLAKLNSILNDSPSLAECVDTCRASFGTSSAQDTREEREARTEVLQKCTNSCNEKFMSSGQGPTAALQGAMTDMVITMLRIFGPVLVIVVGVKFVYNQVGGR